MKEKIWFSHREERYDAELKDNQRVFHWTGRSDIWDWSRCKIYAVSRPNNKVRVVIRSSKDVYSKYMKKDIEIRYMLGFDISKIYEPREDDYHEPPEHNVKNKIYGSSRSRWVIQLDDYYWIWQWTIPNIKIEDSMIYQIYNMIKEKLEKPDLSKPNIFDVEIKDDDRIIPVIYQPAIDSWNNFLREVHCHKLDKEIEVTLLFNNEELRKHALMNSIYEWFRRWIYGRTIDVETFRIILDNNPKYLMFPNIYSADNDIIQDDVHEDKPDINGDVPKRKIKYYFSNYKHPIIFINTSNHAMAEHDNNHRLWKWEYLAWNDSSPIVYGEESRRDIERRFKPFWRVIIDTFRS